MIAESYERIPRSNLVNMGVLPAVQDRRQRDDDRHHRPRGVLARRRRRALKPRCEVTVVARAEDGSTQTSP